MLAAVEHDEQSLRKAEQEKVDLRVFLETIRKCVDLQELTPTIVNTLIKRIEVHSSTKDENGRKHAPIDIYFTAVGVIEYLTFYFITLYHKTYYFSTYIIKMLFASAKSYISYFFTIHYYLLPPKNPECVF